MPHPGKANHYIVQNDPTCFVKLQKKTFSYKWQHAQMFRIKQCVSSKLWRTRNHKKKVRLVIKITSGTFSIAWHGENCACKILSPVIPSQCQRNCKQQNRNVYSTNLIWLGDWFLERLHANSRESIATVSSKTTVKIACASWFPVRWWWW